jgi:hypothetical protein
MCNFNKGKTLFPTYLITERHDRIAYNLALGKKVDPLGFGL